MSLRTSAACVLVPALAACGGGNDSEVRDTAETVMGERLFRETRFAQSFAVRVDGRRLDRPAGAHDPVVDTTETTGTPLPGPYAGTAINCAACHLVDELSGVAGGGVRTYADFARRSPVPARDDGRTTTPRNSPALVNASLSRDVATFFHFDGEFTTLEALVEATLAGRNYGWLPNERAQAVAHVARVVREDDGSDENAQDHGGVPYGVLFAAPGNLLPAELLLASAFRIDVAGSTDDEVFSAVARLIAQYVRELVFATDPSTGRFSGSAFDVFLRKNALPAAPDAGEPSLDYARRLRAAVAALPNPREVSAEDGRLSLHGHGFRFGALERRGLEVFLAEPASMPLAPSDVLAGGVGSCVRCHAPPAFTDFRFHNVGVAQAEYDGVHGDGAFAALAVPGLATRNADPGAFLPPSAARPDAPGPFLATPSSEDPSRTDLGLWNVFGNPDVPAPQATLRRGLLAQLGHPAGTPDDDLLPRVIGWFKTPSLRDLGQSAPYFHTGAADALEDVVRHYAAFSARSRAGLVRNAAPELAGIALTDADVDPLVAFLRALDEDYE